jgi:GxxExxY protein
MLEEYSNTDATHKIIEILFQVFKNLRKGFSEIVYEIALNYGFTANNIIFEHEKKSQVQYKNTTVKHKFYADFIVFNSIILEIKTIDCFNNSHYNQCLTSLKVSGNELALLANFNSISLAYKRIVSHKKLK